MGTIREKVIRSFKLLDPRTKNVRYRGYTLKKIQENNEAEILNVVMDEARSSYAPEIVIELRSETTEDLESNVQRIVEWIKAWKRDQETSDALE